MLLYANMHKWLFFLTHLLAPGSLSFSRFSPAAGRRPRLVARCAAHAEAFAAAAVGAVVPFGFRKQHFQQ